MVHPNKKMDGTDEFSDFLIMYCELVLTPRETI